MNATESNATTFASLGLIAPLLRAVAEQNYTEPSPIQAQAIPHLLAGRDLVGCAQTGTGKTAAFALPILQRLAAAPRGRQPGRPRVLILTPTRELAIQIDENFADYGRHLPLRHTVIFGGVGQNPQVRAVQAGVDVVVATPGRLLDLMTQRFVDLAAVETFVLDEADRMLDMGFAPDVKRIIARLPAQRQSLLFSATMPEEIRTIAQRLLRDPVRVEVTPVASTVERVDQRVLHVPHSEKLRLLVHVLGRHREGLVLVFSRTKHGANRLADRLGRDGIAAAAIHGNKSQSARQRALEEFRNGQTRVLIATDIAARGIDVKGISLVVNFDLPNEPEAYVHRIGRTARAGADGLALSFCSPEERPFLHDIQRLIRQTIPVDADQPFAASNRAGGVAADRDAGDRFARGRQSAPGRGNQHSRPRQGSSASRGQPRERSGAQRASAAAPAHRPLDRDSSPAPQASAPTGARRLFGLFRGRR